MENIVRNCFSILQIPTLHKMYIMHGDLGTIILFQSQEKIVHELKNVYLSVSQP